MRLQFLAPVQRDASLVSGCGTARTPATESNSAGSYYRARYYDANAGHFLSEDPIEFAGGMNFYQYVSNTPPNASDPVGLWSPAAHRQLIWNALHGCNGISGADIWQIQQGSQWFDDNFQDPIWSFGHAMSNGNASQSPADAKKATAAFIAGQVGIAKNDMGAGARNQGLFTFGVAMHPVMDGTSPAHTDPQGNPIPWCGYTGCGGLDGLKQVNQHSAYDITGIERVQDLTIPIQQKNTRMIRNWYQALTGQTLDCGCEQ